MKHNMFEPKNITIPEKTLSRGIVIILAFICLSFILIFIATNFSYEKDEIHAFRYGLDPIYLSDESSNTSSNHVTLSLTISNDDYFLIENTYPHLLKILNYNFTRRQILLTEEPSEKMHILLQTWQKSALLDNHIVLNFESESKQKRSDNQTEDQTMEEIYEIYNCQTNYCLYFDANILLISEDPSFSFVAKALQTLQECKECFVVSPMGGLPLHEMQEGTDWNVSMIYRQDPNSPGEMPPLDYRGFWRFSYLEDLKYMLIDKTKFVKFLPFDKDKSWQEIVSEKMDTLKMIRADIMGVYALKIDKMDTDLNLQEIIDCVDEGWYPTAQEGVVRLLASEWENCTEVLFEDF